MPIIGKINRNPDKPSFNLLDYQWLIDAWLQDRAKHVNPETVRGYAQKIKYFSVWWKATGAKSDWLINESLFEEFEAWMRLVYRTWRKEKLAYNTRYDAIRRVREMFKWAYEQEIISVNLSKWVRTAEGSPPVRKAATPDQLQLLIDAAHRTNWPERSMAILALLLGAGLRRKESVARDEDVDGGAINEKDLSGLLIENIIFYAGNAGILTVVGKKTKANPSGLRQVAFDSQVGTCLIAYIDNLGESSGPLLRNARFRERSLGHKGVYYAVKEMISLAGLEDTIDACHQLRRNYSHYWMKGENGMASADFLRRNLGHKNFSQTTEYTMLDATGILEYAHSPFSMLANRKDREE